MERQEILTIRQAAELTPWTARTLYRIAQRDPSSPFRKVWNQWVTTREDLIAWVRAGEKPGPADPMPSVGQSVEQLMAEVDRMRGVR